MHYLYALEPCMYYHIYNIYIYNMMHRIATFKSFGLALYTLNTLMNYYYSIFTIKCVKQCFIDVLN